jgi:DNA-binding CsgD family transcriptional regulator/tetratricopeptide (TPR) repeat protein
MLQEVAVMPELVGRERELQQLRYALEHAQRGAGSRVLISGEAGIGKTSLVQALIDEARSQQILVLTGQCFDLSATPPYGPWLELADRYPENNGLPEVPAVLKRGTGIGELTNQLALFEVARSFVHSVASIQPLVLVLEDMHWADHASLDLLRYIARQVDNHRIMLIATYRDDEITQEHVLFQLLPLLVRESNPVRLDLRRLQKDSIRTLVHQRYGLSSWNEDRLITYLREQAEGNPLYIHEVLRTLEEQKIIYRNGDSWQLGSLRRVPVPSLLAQVIEGRVSRLTESTRHLLQVAAIIGSEISLDIWQALSGADDTALSDTLEKAIDAHLLIESDDGSGVRFTHSLIREALYRGLMLPQRRTLHRMVAETMIERALPHPDAVAYHFQQAGDERAVEWLTRSGEHAQRTYAWITAADRFEAAQAELERNQTRPGERGWLLFRAGRLRRFSDPERALALLTEAANIVEQIRDPVLSAYTKLDLGFLHILTGNVRRGLAEMVDVVPILDALPPDHAHPSSPIVPWIADSLPPEGAPVTEDRDADSETASVNPRIGVVVFWLAIVGRIGEALELGEQYVAKTRKIAHPSIVLRGSIGDAYCGLGISYALAGRVEDARQAFLLARENHNAIGHFRMITADLWHLLISVQLPYHGDLPGERWRLIHEVEAAWQRSEHFGAWHATDTDFQAGRIPILYLEGDWAEALNRGQPGTHSGTPVRRLRSYQAALNLAVRGRLLRAQGELAQAWLLVHELIPNGPSAVPGDTYYEVTVAALQLAIELALDESDLQTARDWLDALDHWLTWSGASLGKAESAFLRARLEYAAGDVESARSLAERAMELATNPRQPASLIAIHRLLGRLHMEAGNLGGADEHLQESLSLAERCSAPFERALTVLVLAEREAAGDNLSKARDHLSTVRRISELLGAGPTLEVVSTFEAQFGVATHQELPFGLTARELEVLRLLATGMSDRAIGEQLFISRHTVMRHVSHILAKLDVDTRTAAASIATRDGLV